MTAKIKKQATRVMLDAIPQDYIKARYLRATGQAFNMAGFEDGEPEAKFIVDRKTGRKKLQMTLNGMTRIEADGSCLILDTLFNRQKLQILCQDIEYKFPKDSTGKEHEIRSKGPDFEVEDESIFDGLDEVAAATAAQTKELEKPKQPKLSKSAKGLVPVAKVQTAKEKAAADAGDNSEGVGGGRRPEVSNPGEITLDVVE